MIPLGQISHLMHFLFVTRSTRLQLIIQTGSESWIGIVLTPRYFIWGPADKSPYKLDHSKWPHAPFNNSTKIHKATILVPTGTAGTFAPLVTTKVVNVFDSIYWRVFGGGNSIYKIQQTFTLDQSSTPGTDLYDWLDAHNSNVQKWIQVGAVYDTAKFWNTTPQWYASFDMWTMSTDTEDSSFPQEIALGLTTGRTATAYISADTVTSGKYWLSISDGIATKTMAVTVSGDTGNTIDIGYTTKSIGGGTAYFPSGTEVEEDSSSGNTYYYGTPTFTYTFNPTSTTTTTSVYSYAGKGGYGSGTPTESTNPAWIQFSCTNALTCP
jgi:hypothetical protein